MSTGVSPSADFTTEQKLYLQGFFADLARRGLVPFAGHTAAGLITHEPADATRQDPLWFQTPVSDLCREERWKYEQDPFAIWERLLEYAARNEAPTEADRFRIKYFELFHVAPAQDSFRLRLRIPGGILSSHQMRGLATMAQE